MGRGRLMHPNLLLSHPSCRPTSPPRCSLVICVLPPSTRRPPSNCTWRPPTFQIWRPPPPPSYMYPVLSFPLEDIFLPSLPLPHQPTSFIAPIKSLRQRNSMACPTSSPTSPFLFHHSAQQVSSRCQNDFWRQRTSEASHKGVVGSFSWCGRGSPSGRSSVVVRAAEAFSLTPQPPRLNRYRPSGYFIL